MPKLTGIAVSQQNDGSLELVAASHARGRGPTMWHTWQVGPGDEWNLWEPFGEPGTGDPGPPAMVQHAADGHLEVFTVSSGDQAVWHRRQSGPEPAPCGRPSRRIVLYAPIAVTSIQYGTRLSNETVATCPI